MAGLLIGWSSTELALPTSGVAATMLQAVAPAQQRILIHEQSISFKGTSNTQSPVLVDAVQQTSAGTGMTANNPTKTNPIDTETVQSTGNRGFAQSVEPAGTTFAGIIEEVHPQTGFLWQAPFGKDMPVPGGKYYGLRVTNSTAVSGTARFLGQE